MIEEQKNNENARPDLRGEENSDKYNFDSNGIEGTSEASLTTKYQSVGSDRAMASGNERKFRAARLGGIRSQLKQLQAEHLAYVEAHGQRLEARLRENREHKSKVLVNIQELEKELDELIAEAEAEAEKE